MSTTYASGTPTGSVGVEPVSPQGQVTFRRAVRSEWIKFSSLRSSWWMLAAAAVGVFAISLVIAYNTGRHFTGLDPEDAALSATLQGKYLAELLVAILGVLFVSGEYGTGMIRSTLAGVPKRAPVLLAKMAVLGGVVLVVMTVTTVVSFLSAQAVLGHYGHGHSVTDPTGLRVVFGTAAYLTLIALIGSAVGWIIRSTAGGISAVVGLILLLPVLLGLLGSFGQNVAQFLPDAAGESFTVSLRGEHMLTPWSGAAAVVTWVVVATVSALVLLRRRDA